MAAAVPWAVASIAGADLEVTTGGWTMDVGLPLVLGAALGMSLAGWGLLILLWRRTGDARRTWTGIALAVLLLSLGGPLTADAPAETRVYLTLMHVAVGAVLIPGLWVAAGQGARSARKTNSRPGRSGASRTSVTR
ncbi:hypothetical protein E1262_22315 [Jiangella aurantiaca]|uniref:Uncharacterized protein n=1 Tax=Jiangella aurantiaca TaxID=2530373 RepID=A0A4R5A5P7_9ACTN|nr:hypothetical protein E1262_22315 [Jiangella aurantiaca]